MKKSKKLLIPAFAILAISIAAAATSTIAWFTSSNRSNVNVSNIIAKAEGNLDATYSTSILYGAQSDVAVGTALPINDTPIAINTLRDASLDISGADATCVERKKNIDGTLATGYNTIDITNDSKDEKALTYYFAKINFNFKISSGVEEGKTYGIFFQSDTRTSPGYIASAVRVGFKSTSYCVWAPYYNFEAGHNSSSAYALKYAKTTDTDAATGTYQYSKIGDNTNDKAFSSHNVKTSSSVNDSNYLGTLDFTNNVNDGLNVTAYIWFEGEDVDCVSNKIRETAITLPMRFYSVAL